ncbi:MAG: 50S ribosomal protein L5, partial [Chloroflexi bacterium]|nr:50S ribosomal protein L5 [Chloroflexota bacterium]
MENRMYTRYLEEVVPTLTDEFGYKNRMQVPT